MRRESGRDSIELYPSDFFEIRVKDDLIVPIDNGLYIKDKEIDKAVYYPGFQRKNHIYVSEYGMGLDRVCIESRYEQRESRKRPEWYITAEKDGIELEPLHVETVKGYHKKRYWPFCIETFAGFVRVSTDEGYWEVSYYKYDEGDSTHEEQKRCALGNRVLQWTYVIPHCPIIRLTCSTYQDFRWNEKWLWGDMLLPDPYPEKPLIRAYGDDAQLLEIIRDEEQVIKAWIVDLTKNDIRTRKKGDCSDEENNGKDDNDGGS